MDLEIENEFLNILKEELVSASGCTEPVSLAYAAAAGRVYLEESPLWITVRCSGNIIKNVRCVRIPNSGGMSGINAAVTLGAFAGDAKRKMKVLEKVEEEQREKVHIFLQQGRCQFFFLDSDIPLHFQIELSGGKNHVFVEVKYSHTNIVRLEKNGIPVSDCLGEERRDTKTEADRSLLNVKNIKEFADQIAIDKIRDLFDQQIYCNMRIAYEGMTGKFGLGIGTVIREYFPDCVISRMKAFAAAASEARMAGCEMPVIINSGSGNQGIASSVPVIVYAEENGKSIEELYRALAFSALLTVYQKEYVGKLSAFCGAVSASCAAGAAITYLCGGSALQIENTIDNTLANIPGILCDGAKISCASKIATCIDAAMMAHNLAMRGCAYEAHSGVLQEDTEKTIGCIGYIGKVGMQETDREIIRMMMEEEGS